MDRRIVVDFLTTIPETHFTFQPNRLAEISFKLSAMEQQPMKQSFVQSENDNVYLLPSSTLAPYTLVKVVGNNRTKSLWVGKVGLVVGHHALGGWHKVFLDNDSNKPIVKIQRNALKLVSSPTLWHHLVNQWKKYQRQITEQSKRQKIHKKTYPCKPLSISDLTKSFIWDENSPTNNRMCLSYACLERLSDTSLERYCNQFRLLKSCKRRHMIATILHHFQQQLSVNEEDTIVNFLSIIATT